MKIILGAVGLTCFVSAALADDVSCGSDGNQRSITLCAEQDYRTADGELNVVYGELIESISAPGHETLRTAQRKWIAYRDAQCDFDSAGTQGGSIHPYVLLTCLADLTQMQSQRLKRQLECVEGDLSCGGQ
ncbi:lysozyme inhibitor LprI family protein [Yoonia sp. MH D7]